MNNIIEFKNVSKQYDHVNKINVLNKINFNFKKGNIYSLVGPSGSGKSTLLNLLSLIDRPTTGTIRIFNNTINYNKSKDNDLLRAKKIGIIYQENNLLPDFTALENVYLARLAISNNKKKAIYDALTIINKLGISKRKNHFSNELSGGEIQRFAISRALINSPEIILADEPTGNLDASTADSIMELLLSLPKSCNLGLVVATHNQKFALRCDRVLILKGKIASPIQL